MAKRAITIKGTTPTITIGEAFEEFINEKATQGVVQKTLDNYCKSYGYFLEFELDDDDSFNIAELNKVYILQWVDSMLQQGKKTTTINTYLRDVRVFLYWCMDADRLYIETPYKISLVSGQVPLPKIFTDEEVLTLLTKPNDIRDYVEWRTWVIVNWVLATGNRAATICEIQIGDLDFTNRKIALRHTKNKQSQIIDMAESLVPILKHFIRTYRNGEPKEAYLFADYTTNKKMSYNALAHSFARYCKARGVEHTNIHGLRHYFSTKYVDEGGSSDKLQRILGHSTNAMTQRYLSLTDKQVNKDFDRFNPLNNIKANTTRRKRVGYNGDKGQKATPLALYLLLGVV